MLQVFYIRFPSFESPGLGCIPGSIVPFTEDVPACCLKDLISTLYFLPFSLILVCNIAKLLLINTHLFNQLTLMILFHLDVLFMQEILPDPEACTLVVLVYLLYEVLQEAPSCSVLQCEVLYCFVHPLLSLKIQSNMCL